MKTYAGVVYTSDATNQLQSLIDEDIRYELEARELDWILQRDPEMMSTLKEIEGEAVYIFLTAQKGHGPQRLAVTFRITPGPVRFVEIIDIRSLPHTAMSF
jgi:hypothetical protein